MTAIPFAEKAWPIVTGCDKIKKGCDLCFAARLAATRLKHRDDYKGLAEYRDGRGHWIAPPRFNEHRLTDPLRWRKPRHVFVAHTGDLMHKSIRYKDVGLAFATMALAPRHTFMVFTKRWARACRILSSEKAFPSFVQGAMVGLAMDNPGVIKQTAPFDFAWPLPNVHLVFSASTQSEADECAPILLDTPAAKRGLSLEPLLEHIDLLDCERDYLSVETYHDAMHTGDGTGIVDEPGLDFVICGGETSLRKSLARPCPVDAPRSLLGQCQETSTPFWFKGWGAHLPAGQVKGLLDGVKHEEMP